MVEVPGWLLVKLGAALGRAELGGRNEIEGLQKVMFEWGAFMVEKEGEDWMEELGFVEASRSALSRLRDLGEDSEGVELRKWCWALATRLEEGFRERLVLGLGRDREGYYKGGKKVWGEAAIRFEEAAWDMREAGKCYAFDRYTACVFHVMRVLEHGLKALAGTIPSFKCEGSLKTAWGNILRKIDDEIKKKPSEEKEKWFRGREEFYSAASSFMWAVKTAWRDECMHAEREFGEEEAKRILVMSGNLMRYIAENVGE